MPAVNAATQSTSTRSTRPAAETVQFKTFSPNTIATKADGSVTLKGMLNRSVNAEVHLTADGKVMVESNLWSKQPGPGHEASRGELKELKAALTRFLSTARLNQKTALAYQKLEAGLDAALAPAKPAQPKKVSLVTQQRLLQSANHALHNSANLKWQASMPLGVRYVEVPLFREKHPDGYSFSAMVPVGALTPTAKVGDPNLASNFIIKRTGGLAGGTMYSKSVDVVR